MNLTENWKNKNVFEKQLKLNQYEFSVSYPQHWKDFIQEIRHQEIKRILDVGCGSGIYYKLCKKELPHIEYYGVDYSSEAIEIAKKEYSDKNFSVMSINEMTSDFLQSFDLIHLGAVLDVLPNGDEVLEQLLKLKPKKLFIGRIKITNEKSNYIEYMAYDEIMTYEYRHNYDNLIQICNRNNYQTKFISNNLLLIHDTN